jgi:putative ATPase
MRAEARGMSDLFSEAGGGYDAPLAERMRPRVLDDIVGQDHIVGPGRLLRRAIQADRLSSLIFYGPPGTGKTSLARVIANTTAARFESLNAVLSGIKDIRDAIERASQRRRLYGQRTILFVDEVHRWNKAQQDALLPWVENGTVVLVGATTENPFFEVNRALVSRSRVFQLKALLPADLMLAARRALSDCERGYGKLSVSFEEGALEHLVEVAGGDARSLFNALELAVETTPPTGEGASGGTEAGGIHISVEAAEESIQRRAVLYDKDGDYHFDTISAFIKSVRGSDPDAALYWLAKMLSAGEDPAFIFRRMIILASEDVGMADPAALGVVVACAQAFERIGFPEGNYPLAEACLYLSTAPKSNSAMAFFDALAVVEKEDAEVPSHLRDASRDKEGFGHGEGYVYPHAYREHWRAQQYLPSGLQGKLFYTPSRSGYEEKIREEVLRKRELQAAALLGEASLPGDGEYLSWSRRDKGLEAWARRLESGRGRLLLFCRDAIIAEAAPKRHERLLVLKADDGLLVWEGLRRVPEGLCAACVTSEAARETLLRFSGGAALDDVELPKIAVCAALPSREEAEGFFDCAVFDMVLAREPWRGVKMSVASVGAFAAEAASLLAPGGRLVFLASPPFMGERLSRIAGEAAGEGGGEAAALLSVMKEAEDEFFAAAATENKAESLFWDEETLKEGFAGGPLLLSTRVINLEEERLVTERDVSAWFNSERSRWGGAIRRALGEKGFETVKSLISVRARQGAVPWKWKSLLCTARLPVA